MHVGASQKRLARANMPKHEEVVAFTKLVMKHLPEYEIVAEHIPSRVVMCAKKKFFIEEKWQTWIDFPKYTELVNNNESFTSLNYLKPTPPASVGLSGLTTNEFYEQQESREEKKVEKQERTVKKEQPSFFLPIAVQVNEKTAELDFWEGKKVSY